MAQARWSGAFRVPRSEAPGVRAFLRAWREQPLGRLAARALAALAGSYAIFALAYVSFKRIRHPYDLEWMEGGSLVHVARVLDGAPLYTPPSLDWTPYIYTPLYWYVSAAFAKFMGLGIFAPRLVSLLATGVSLLAIYACVRRDGSRLSAFLAAALFAATFRLSGSWFDIARPDMLACALGCTSIWLLGSRSPSLWRDALAASLLAGSVLSKQTWLLAACAVMTASVVERPRHAVVLVASFVLPLASFWVLAHFATGGWSTYYTLRLPFEHDVVSSGFSTFFVYDLSRNYGPVTCLAIAAFVLVPRDERRFFGIVALGCLGAALAARLHSGGYDNVLIPGYAVLAILAGRAIAYAERSTESAGGKNALGIVALTAVVVQIASLHYDVSAEIPVRKDRVAGKRIVEILKSQPGDVLIPYHTGFCLLAKKPCHAHWMAMNDVLRGSQEKPRTLLRESMRKTFSSGRISAVITDDQFGGDLVPFVNEHFPKRTQLDNGGGPTPKTGYITRPVELRTRP
jgi:4-amino-4-deoxy-L-arabinose transferase-like glycosyltransferase